ncbi:MAG TPA: trimethylamine methyltransferase family protein [Clostridiales bacterium]|nr:trimethylamine methyltransferase family protein [Clostridiales bacterium]
MSKFTLEHQPLLRFLKEEDILKIHEAALKVLAKTGVFFDSEEALTILRDAGCSVDFDQKIARFPKELVEKSLSSVPETFELFGREGENPITIGGENCYFDPGSAGLNFLESDNCTARPAVSGDIVKIYRLCDGLENFPIQSTAVSLADVPKKIADCYRVYLLLKNTVKPMAVGAFDVEGVANIAKLLTQIRGSEAALREKPLAFFDICSSPSLKWTHISCHNIIDCAKLGLPMETISVPMPGAVSPATLAGSLLIHVAETLSGIVLAQSVNPGNPMIFGGAPMTFDMRFSTTSLNAVETNLISTAYAQMARYYGMPCHTYAGLADAKTVDAQAGLETAFSALLAAAGGLHVIAGPGMLDFVNTFSLEKLVIDHEIVAMTKRLQKGFAVNDETLCLDLIDALGPGGDYMSAEHTLRHFKEELYIPPLVIDKKNRNAWEAQGGSDIFARAKAQVTAILEHHEIPALTQDTAVKLDGAMTEIMAAMDIVSLPLGPERS